LNTLIYISYKMVLNYEKMNWRDVRDLFRKWRDENERCSEDIIQLWEAILEDNVHKCGNERHLIFEQVVVASLDTSRFDIATKCLKVLGNEFPGSTRVLKLKAMRLEAMERYDEAIEVLDTIIQEDETNAAFHKRKIAVLKARGKRLEAIKELTKYLKLFMSDVEAWQELCSLYLAEEEYSKAAFCMEEVLLHNPHSHLVHQRLAEIRYTMGGLDNLEVARTYYSQAIKLNPNNLRALYGLYMTCTAISNCKVLSVKRKDALKTAAWALEQTKQLTLKNPKNKGNNQLLESLVGFFGSLEVK